MWVGGGYLGLRAVRAERAQEASLVSPPQAQCPGPPLLSRGFYLPALHRSLLRSMKHCSGYHLIPPHKDPAFPGTLGNQWSVGTFVSVLEHQWEGWKNRPHPQTKSGRVGAWGIRDGGTGSKNRSRPLGTEDFHPVVLAQERRAREPKRGRWLWNIDNENNIMVDNRMVLLLCQSPRSTKGKETLSAQWPSQPKSAGASSLRPRSSSIRSSPSKTKRVKSPKKTLKEEPPTVRLVHSPWHPRLQMALWAPLHPQSCSSGPAARPVSQTLDSPCPRCGPLDRRLWLLFPHQRVLIRPLTSPGRMPPLCLFVLDTKWFSCLSLFVVYCGLFVVIVVYLWFICLSHQAFVDLC